MAVSDVVCCAKELLDGVCKNWPIPAENAEFKICAVLKKSRLRKNLDSRQCLNTAQLAVADRYPAKDKCKKNLPV